MRPPSIFKLPPLLICLCLISSCGNNEQNPNTAVFSGIAMTIPYKITINGRLTPEQSGQLQKIIEITFEEINRVYNKYNPDSELSLINRMKEKENYSPSPELHAFLRYTDLIVELTKGRFDPTIEPLQKLWKDKLEQGMIPSPAEIRTLRQFVGWDKLHLSEEMVQKTHSALQIDLGGIAKGYAVDLLARRIIQQGFSSMLVDWGGEFYAAGTHPDNRPWTIAIYSPDPASADHVLGTVPLQNQALATSGNYFQYWTVVSDNGIENTYSHILDIQTGRLIDNKTYPLISVTVTAPNCTLADALATAAMMCTDKDSALAWAEEIECNFPGVRFHFAFQK